MQVIQNASTPFEEAKHAMSVSGLCGCSFVTIIARTAIRRHRGIGGLESNRDSASAYMIPVRPSPPPSPPQWFLPTPPCGVVWWWVASLPPLWCGVVWLWVASPLPVVWCGSGVGFGGSPLHPLWRGMGWVVPPACLDLLGVFGKPMLLDRGGTIFVTVVALEQSEFGLQWVNCHRDRACQGTWST